VNVVGNTAMKNMNYSAPQESASCGQIKCRTCGKPFIPVKNHPMYKDCSVICRKIRHDNFLKEWRKTNKEHIAKSKLEWVRKNLDRVKKYRHEYGKKWRKENSERKKETNKKYQKENMPRILVLAKIRYDQGYKAKDHQKTALIRNFGTSVVPMSCKKIIALKHVIENGKATKKIIESISEGRTYEAYV